MFKKLGFAIIILMVWTQPGQANFTQSILICDSDTAHPDVRIMACTRNIESGRFIGRNLAVAFTNRGDAYRRKGQFDQAIADYDQAIQLQSNDAGFIVSRGNAYYYKGAFDRAIENYDEAIRLNPNLALAYGNRGNVHRRIGQLEQAIRNYDKAIQLTPDDAQIFADRGLAYEASGDTSQALRDFNKAYDLGFRHPLLLRKLRQLGRAS